MYDLGEINHDTPTAMDSRAFGKLIKLVLCFVEKYTFPSFDYGRNWIYPLHLRVFIYLTSKESLPYSLAFDSLIKCLHVERDVVYHKEKREEFLASR